MQPSTGEGSGLGSYYRTMAAAIDQPEGGGGGGRRRRLVGYLKAANELRQTYYPGYASRPTETDSEYNDVTGDQPSSSWLDVGVMRSGDEELVLFPSYARQRPDARSESEKTGEDRARYTDEEDWMNDQQNPLGEKDDNVIDVDVRGWLYAPHSGPPARKHRYIHWAALKMCGLPAQTSAQPGKPDRNPTASEAEFTQETPVAIAQSERAPSIYTADETLGGLARANTAPVDAATIKDTQSLPSQSQQQAQLSPAEIASAHATLSARLAPFTHRAIPDTPVTVFFFNSKSSQSRTLVTSETGHFAIRVALPFIPTHVRVLASETLSATEKVIVHEPSGISLISDIDDTVKHSAVSMGAREIFRNTFAAPLSTLRIPGVADWYSRLAGAPYNVNFHYVSNSPWQLYPVLKSFFEVAGLPAGSMHLKQYSGMLQGIFEPVAERKKGTMERVLKDFPQRRWILVGDSGEADLEIYTEIVEKFPGKILAVFIRDITTTPTPNEKGFFDSNESQAQYSKAMQEWADEKAASIKERPAKVPPPLPPKRRSGSFLPQQGAPAQLSPTSIASTKVPPPEKPPKPAELRSMRTPAPPSSPSLPTRLTSVDSSGRSLRNAPSPSHPPSPPPPSPPPLPRRTTAFSGAIDGQAIVPNAPLSPVKPSSQASPLPSMTAQQQQQQQEVLLNKREELWNRRWEHALMIMERNDVLLKSWRIGGDVEVICRSIVEEALWGR